MSILDDFRVAMAYAANPSRFDELRAMVVVPREVYVMLTRKFGRHPTADEYYLWLREQCEVGE